MDIKYENGSIVITVPYNGDPSALPLSGSGKSKMVASTSGFTPVEGSPDPKLKVSLNVISVLAKK